MKSYDETISNVFDRIGEYETKQKRKRSVITKTAASFCCVCAVALVGVGVWQGDNAGSQTYVNPSTASTGISGDVMLSGKPDSDVIVFNEISEKVPTKAPSEMGIALFREDEVVMTKEEINEYFGANVFPTCPDGFTEKTSRLHLYRRNKGTGEVYSDFNQISYLNADKGFSVTFSTNNMFFLTEYYLGDKCNDIEKSVINNVEVLLAEVKEVKGYYAEFTYKGVMFTVFSENMTQDEFLSIIYSIVS